MGLVRRIALFAAVFLGPQAANAFTQTVTSQGVPVRWKGGSAKLDLAGNPINSSGMSSSDFFAAVTRSLRRWEGASNGTLSFDYWQGTDPRIYTAAAAYDGLSTIYFASNAKDDPHLNGNVLGLTQVWYDTNKGEILEADIVLNDKNFRFTTDPRDTSGYGSGGPSNPGSAQPSVFVENVITHELGHAFGFAHAGGMQSTMLFMESPEQAHLGCDEFSGVRAIYPRAGATGRITGSVTASGGAVFAAQVTAISRRRGTVMASALTDPKGQFALSGLEPGDYFLMAEPFFAGASTLPAYYSGARSDVCSGGKNFGRTPLLDSGGLTLRTLTVSANGVVSAPPIEVGCTSGSGASVSAASTSASWGSASVIYSGVGAGFGAADRFGASSSAYYRLNRVSGHLEVRSLSFSLYSPVRTRLQLLDAEGTPVLSARETDPVYTGDSGYMNYDSELVADGLPAGDYLVKVSSFAVDATYYPAGPISIDSVPFVVLTGSVNEGDPPLAGDIPFNARCRMDENFAAYSSPPGDPPRHSASGNSGVGFCAQVDDVSRKATGSRRGPGASGASVLGWFLPFLTMVVSGWGIRRLGRRIPA